MARLQTQPLRIPQRLWYTRAIHLSAVVVLPQTRALVLLLRPRLKLHLQQRVRAMSRLQMSILLVKTILLLLALPVLQQRRQPHLYSAMLVHCPLNLPLLAVKLLSLLALRHRMYPLNQLRVLSLRARAKSLLVATARLEKVIQSLLLLPLRVVMYLRLRMQLLLDMSKWKPLLTAA